MKDQTVVLKKVSGKDDVEDLRKIRNECREFMTRKTTEISKIEQDKWYSSIDESTNVYLLWLVEFGSIVHPIGYGLIRKENGCSLISGGLLESYRGNGYGKTLFKYIMDNVDKDSGVRLEVLKTNTKAFSIYNNLGFRVIEDDGRVITMEYKVD